MYLRLSEFFFFSEGGPSTLSSENSQQIIVRKRKRFSPWIRKDKIKDLELVKSYYGYSNEKAKQALRILTKEQLNFIKSKFETGGTK